MHRLTPRVLVLVLILSALPLYAAGMPTVGLSLVNHDNNQHGPDENLRLRNLWEGIEIMASIMTMRADR